MIALAHNLLILGVSFYNTNVAVVSVIRFFNREDCGCHSIGINQILKVHTYMIGAKADFINDFVILDKSQN